MKKYLSTTKGNYHRTSRKSYRGWLIGTITLICFGLIFPWLVSSVSSTVLYPINVTANWFKTSDSVFPVYVRSRTELIAELESLKEQMATSASTRLSVDRLLEENMQLRAMANAGTSTERLLARVIANPSKLAYDLLQIDRGTDDGVVVGSPVYTGMDTVIGVVVHTANSYAFVDLFTTSGFETTAYIVGPNVFATLEGMGGGIARVKLPQGVPIAEGQLVILPGVSSGVYGEIISIENLPTQPEQYGYVAPPVSLSSLRYVSVSLDAVNVKDKSEIGDEIRSAIRAQMVLDDNIISSLSDIAEETEESDSEEVESDVVVAEEEESDTEVEVFEVVEEVN